MPKFSDKEVDRVFDHYFGATPIILADLTDTGKRKMMQSWGAKKLIAAMRSRKALDDLSTNFKKVWKP